MTRNTLLAASSSSSSLDDRAWRSLGPRSCTTARRPSYIARHTTRHRPTNSHCTARHAGTHKLHTTLLPRDATAKRGTCYGNSVKLSHDMPNITAKFPPITSMLQTSTIGPILFLIYINDIVDLFSNSDVSTKLFADDIKIYLELTSEADYSTLQKSINRIFDWSKTWQLKLAHDKCQHNHISLSAAACRNAYFVSDAKLPIVQNVRD